VDEAEVEGREEQAKEKGVAEGGRGRPPVGERLSVSPSLSGSQRSLSEEEEEEDEEEERASWWSRGGGGGRSGQLSSAQEEP